jgi:thiosulfate reductase cytochrome b subunit
MKARRFQEAQQIAGVVVLPVVALLLAQVTGVLLLSPGLLPGLGAVVFVLDAALVWAGTRAFEPEALLTSS